MRADGLVDSFEARCFSPHRTMAALNFGTPDRYAVFWSIPLLLSALLP